MPKPAQSFIAEHARGDRKAFDTLDACLFEETKALHEDLISAVTFLHFVDGVSIEREFERIRPKFTALKQKALEWQAARSARKEEFEQRDAADMAQQEAYWAKFYENKERIARAIARDVALKEQAQRRANKRRTGAATDLRERHARSPAPVKSASFFLLAVGLLFGSLDLILIYQSRLNEAALGDVLHF